MTDYTPTTEEALYCSSCWADLKLYPPATELVFERDFTVNTETVRKVYRYVRTDATEFDRWLAEVKAGAWEEGAIWQRANAVPDDRRMRARFVGELQAVNPYREGTK